MDTFAAAFAVAGEDQEQAADKETLVLLKRFSGSPAIEKAKAEFARARKVEAGFGNETKMPRAITSRWILENQISTWLSHDE